MLDTLQLKFTPRTKRMVGRQEELERLLRYLHERGESHFVYYEGGGGLGKTRLLEAVQEMVEKAGPAYRSTGIIDLYHADTHSPSEVERTIVSQLDKEENYFTEYRRARREYELKRERGIDPSTLEQLRQALSEHFINGWRDLALEMRKLVIIVDTLELLQHESSKVEDRIGPATTDTRLKPWLLDQLPQLPNVLVVMAGRPKPQRLVEDLKETFAGKNLDIVELKPLSFEETQELISTIIEPEDETSEELSDKYLPVVHRLTAGKPIFLHLIIDLLQGLSKEPQNVFRLFDEHIPRVGTTEEPTQWDQVREEVERDILTALFNRSGLWSEYLSSIAFMPKGVTASILRVAWGMRIQDAEELLKELEPLSFVKRYKPLRTSDLSQHAQYFLHDEMYRLMTRPGVIPNLRFKEIRVAHNLIENYYSAQIEELKTQIADIPLSEERVRLRERLQRLQIDRLYYLFVRDPLEGYEEYKRLSSSANRHRWIGFSMSLLDEFLRFYYADTSSGGNQQLTSRREAFEKAGLSHEQIVRESAWMWIERFDWWGQDERLIRFAEWVFEHPDDLFIQPDKDLAIWGNITAFWTGARARQYGYESEAVERADSVLGSLPRLSQCTTEEAFARARLCTAIGFQYRLAGMIDRAIDYYQKARAAFMELGQPTLQHEEHALLLSSMAFAFAEQGNMRLARPLAHEALRINEEMGNDYSRGLTLATLSQIARMRENYGKAREYAQESNEVFQELGDVRGVALAILRMAQAKRRWAKHELEKERSRDEAKQQLTQALRGIKESLQNVEEAGIASLIPELVLEQGLVHREMGRMIHEYEGLKAAIPEYSKALESLRRAHSVSSQHGTQQHDVLQDMAEVTFHMGDLKDAHAILDQIQEEVGQGYYFESWQNLSPDHLPPEPFRTLGKVELLRGQIAFREGQSSGKESRKKCEEGLKHYALAYAYFTRFSPDAVHKETMLEYVFNHLRDIIVEDRRAAFSTVSKWLGEQQLGIDTTSFVNDITYLFGV